MMTDLLRANGTFKRPKRRLWRLRIVCSFISLLMKLTASFVIVAYEGWIKRKYPTVQRFKDGIKTRLHTTLLLRFATSLTEIIVHRNKIELVLHVLNVTNYRSRLKWLPQWEGKENEHICLQQPEKSVTCEILHSPKEGKVRADVIFIHGLHGSIVHTWKQGLWNYRKKVKNSPLQHKWMAFLPQDLNDSDAAKEVCSRRKKEYVCDKIRSSRNTETCIESGEEHDPVLENITDIINNIDDRIKEAKGGSAEKQGSMEPYSPCWPRDWLPKDCPGVRVIAVNYTTDPFLWRPVWIAKRIRTSMTERSGEMEEHLMKLGVGQNPIVWVGHSKGGLFIKQMLVDAKHSDDSKLRRFVDQTKAIMFYSVPHRGSSLAHLNLPLLRQSIELTEVKKDCHEVLSLHREFMKLYEENSLTAEIYSFVETILTFMFVMNVRVVSVDSADIGLGEFRGVNIDHREICKPLNRDCFLYRELTRLINRQV